MFVAPAKANRPQILLRHPLHQPLLTMTTISNFKHGKYLAVHRILLTVYPPRRAASFFIDIALVFQPRSGGMI